VYHQACRIQLPDVLILNESLSDVDVRNESDVLVDRLSDFSVPIGK
jgi:hypothetical protein